MTLVAGEAVMRALTPPIYHRLAELGESLRQKLRRTLQATGVPTQVTGIASLFGIHFNARPIKSYRDVVADDAEMTKGLYTGLLNEGILLQTSCFGALGVMTTDAEIDTLVDAVGRVVRRLRE
jgi:glutamate-1-semialdehyde 2,1-aminomutase